MQPLGRCLSLWPDKSSDAANTFFYVVGMVIGRGGGVMLMVVMVMVMVMVMIVGGTYGCFKKGWL